MLIGYELGLITLWDMKAKCAEIRWQSHEPLRSISWHHEGKHFVSSHIDGSLCTWPLRATPKPQLLIYPHAKPTKDGKLETCKPIHKVDLKTNRNGFVYYELLIRKAALMISERQLVLMPLFSFFLSLSLSVPSIILPPTQ